MGWGSYQDDNLDAKGESQKHVAQVPTIETRVVKKGVVKKGKPKNKLRRKSPIQEMVETILMQYAGSSYLTLPEWVEQVRPHLEKNGETSPGEDLKTVVAKALIFLDYEGHARQISLDHSTGKWKVFQRIHTQSLV